MKFNDLINIIIRHILFQTFNNILLHFRGNTFLLKILQYFLIKIILNFEISKVQDQN